MAEQLNGDKIHLVRQLLVAILLLVQLRRGSEAIHEDQGRFRRIIGVGTLICSVDAAKMRHMDNLGVRHVVSSW